MRKFTKLTITGALLISASISSLAQDITPENRYLQLRDQMEKAENVKEQKSILTQMGETGTFQAMAYTANWMTNRRLRKTAAQVTKKIAMAHPEYNGINYRLLLKTAQAVLSEKEEREIEDFLGGLSKDEEGFVSIFNGTNLNGWKGLVQNPIARAKMTGEELAKAQEKADQVMREDWKVEDGMLTYVGHGYDNICTVNQYADFEMLVDWKLDPAGKEPDAGVYLRGTPQVQIWDIARVNVGAQVGSGGLYNNQKNRSTPLEVADNKLGEWNTFYIRMVGDKVTVKLNGKLVVDNVVMENYWDRKQPIFPREQIEMQAHGSRTWFRDIYIREINETAVRMYGDMTISNDDLGVFVDCEREILGVHLWEMNFADLVYQAEVTVRPTIPIDIKLGLKPTLLVPALFGCFCSRQTKPNISMGRSTHFSDNN